jgi:hypothetical protein
VGREGRIFPDDSVRGVSKNKTRRMMAVDEKVKIVDQSFEREDETHAFPIVFKVVFGSMRMNATQQANQHRKSTLRL